MKSHLQRLAERRAYLIGHFGSTDGTAAGIPDAADRAKLSRDTEKMNRRALNPDRIYSRWNSASVDTGCDYTAADDDHKPILYIKS